MANNTNDGISASLHEKWMRYALDEAKKALSEGEIPIGAVIVSNGRIIGKGHNMTEALKDVTAHAEMIAMTAASTNISGKYLNDCTLYVTVEPCVMCAGAIGWSQIKHIVYGCSDVKRGYTSLIPASKSPFHPKANVISGILEQECSNLMKDFFLNKR